MKKQVLSVVLLASLMSPQGFADTTPRVTDQQKDQAEITADRAELKTLHGRIVEQRQKFQADQKAYVSAVKQFGENSPQAQAAKATLKADKKQYVSLVHQRNKLRHDLHMDVRDVRRDRADVHRDMGEMHHSMKTEK